MEQKNINSFWLFVIKNNSVQISFISAIDNNFKTIATSQQQNWFKEEQFLKSIDICISDCFEQNSLIKNPKTTHLALILPPSWVAVDGKIDDNKQKLIKSVCKNLDFNPIGFLNNDEAIIEELNQKGDTLASLIIINIEKSILNISIAYLGKIKNRLTKNIIEGQSLPSLVKDGLKELKFDSALPPEILLWGTDVNDCISDFKNYPWTDEDGIFIHSPEIKLYHPVQITQIFTKVISKQIKTDFDIPETKKNTLPPPEQTSRLEEVDPASLNFGSKFSIKKEDIDIVPEPETSSFLPELKLEKQAKQASAQSAFGGIKKRLNLKNLLRFKKLYYLLFLIPFSSLLAMFIFWVFFCQSILTVFISPYEFNQESPYTIDTSHDNFNPDQKIIPVEEIEISFSVSATTRTTGQKLIGEKAKGELLIFNKTNEEQTISTGSLLTDPNGLEFRLLDDVKIASSSPDLDQGIITLGQSKVMASAVNIGPESNLSQNTELTFKEFSSNNLIAKANQVFAGGNSQQVNSVSSEDKEALKEKIDSEIEKKLKQEQEENVNKLENILPQTLHIKKDKISYNREIGEQTDELSASVDIHIYSYSVPAKVKEDIIKSMLQTQVDLSTLDLENSNFNFDFKTDNQISNKTKGTLLLTGMSPPKINTDDLKRQLIFKNLNKVTEILKQKSDRIYDFNIQFKPSFFKNFPFLPLTSKMIDLQIKIEQ